MITLKQIEDQIDYYDEMINFERNLLEEGLCKDESKLKALERESRRWLRMSIDRRAENGLAH